MRYLWLALLIVAAAPLRAEDGAATHYIEKGDKYMSIYQFQLAAMNYKLALMRDPENSEAWDKHRQAVERLKAVDHYLDKTHKYTREGRFEEAQEAAQNALKLDPRNAKAWSVYEHALQADPDVYVIQNERDAWDAYRDAKDMYEHGHIESAQRSLDQIYKFTQDPTLKFYAKSYLQKVQLKLKETYPSTKIVVTEK